MNNIEKLNEYISYLMIPQNELGKFSICPYAKKFFDFIQYKFSDNLEKDINFYLKNFPKDKKIMLLACEDIITYSPHYLQNLVDKYQKIFNEKDLWIIFDHPNIDNEINGVKTNNQYFALFLIQPLSEIIDLSDKLLNTHYYNYWSKKYFDEIVVARKELLK